MSPASEVYICDKVADHGKGKPCRKLVEGGGIQVEIAAAALPLETDEKSAVIYRQFHNAADAQHWLRRISVKDLLAVVYPHEQGALINGAPEDEPVSTDGLAGTEDDAKKPKARSR